MFQYSCARIENKRKVPCSLEPKQKHTIHNSSATCHPALVVKVFRRRLRLVIEFPSEQATAQSPVTIWCIKLSMNVQNINTKFAKRRFSGLLSLEARPTSTRETSVNGNYEGISKVTCKNECIVNIKCILTYRYDKKKNVYFVQFT